LGRTLADLVALVTEFEQRKINFESLTEKIGTSSPAGRLVFHVFAALAEFERNLIRERTVADLKAAVPAARKGGRAVLRQVSPMVIRLISVSDQLQLLDFHNIFRAVLGWDGDLGYIIRIHGQEFNSFRRKTRSKSPA
jgi:DNA invertase Pin-like site-specific DNA recombinase